MGRGAKKKKGSLLEGVRWKEMPGYHSFEKGRFRPSGDKIINPLSRAWSREWENLPGVKIRILKTCKKIP
jgi:hypothetical protein